MVLEGNKHSRDMYVAFPGWGEVYLLQNEHSIPDMLMKKIYPHLRPCLRSSQTDLNRADPRAWMEAWGFVDRTEEINVTKSTRSFMLKRFPDGLINFSKGWLFYRGDQNLEAIEFFKIYEPVVQCTTVCLLLILGVFLNLKSKQGDITAEFIYS